ncbi:DUF3080 family protein [Pseudoalteromonas sp. 68 DY56-GL68]|uniref:DUF3080 family protein n=1 Tax=Pseudoalteromonas sp. 68 DY56-GL68 TaxID=2974919 RepID=UPI00352B8BD5
MHLLNIPKTFLKLTVIMVSFLVVACSESSGELNQTYAQRLHNVLKFNDFELKKPTTFPVQHDKIDAHNNTTIGMLELAQLRQCKLAILIAEHNNQLGKTASAANILKYQLDFLQSANTCLATLEQSDELYKKIAFTAEQKTIALPTFFQAMLNNEPEFKQTWQLTSVHLAEDTSGFTETEQAMQEFAKLAEQINSGNVKNVDTESIVKNLQVLNQFNYNKLLISAARTQISYNNQLTKLLTQFSSNELCPLNKNKQKARTLSNIFKKFYLQQLQPYQSFLTGKLEALQPLYLQVWGDTSMHRYVSASGEHAILEQLKQSAKSHVQWWQNFYKECEISPL